MCVCSETTKISKAGRSFALCNVNGSDGEPPMEADAHRWIGDGRGNRSRSVLIGIINYNMSLSLGKYATAFQSEVIAAS